MIGVKVFLSIRKFFEPYEEVQVNQKEFRRLTLYVLKLVEMQSSARS